MNPYSAIIKKMGKKFLVRLFDKDNNFLGKASFGSYNEAYRVVKTIGIKNIHTDSLTIGGPLAMIGKLMLGS